MVALPFDFIQESIQCRNLSLPPLLAAGLITTPAMAADAPAAKATPAYIAGSAIRTDAEVMSIDLPSRKVGLKLEDGTIAQVVVGKEVRNLAQVKVGDHVVAEYARALSLKLKKGPGLRVTEEIDTCST
jgi:hypothetical protein